MRFDRQDKNESWFFLLLVALLSVPALAPLTYPGSFQTLSGLSAVYNLINLDAHFAWAPVLFRGLDLFRGDGLLPYALAEAFHLAGLSFLDSLKLFYALALLLSGLGMFLLARRAFASAPAGLLASALYVYFPYHLALVYVRGAPGESAFAAVAPFALLAYARLRANPGARLSFYIPVALAFFLLALTVPGLALLFTLGALLGFELLDRRPARALELAARSTAAAGAGILLGFAPPLLATTSHLAAGSIHFVPAFVYPFQFFTATWGTAAPRGNFQEAFPFQLGAAALGLALFALVSIWLPAQNGAQQAVRNRRIMLTLLALSGALLLAMMPFAAPLWELAQATRLVEYPFEMIGWVALALGLAGGGLVARDRRLAQASVLAALVAFPILATYSYLAPEYLHFTPVHPPLAVFNDNELGLLDARIVRPVGPLRHGATVDVEFQWQALRQVNHDYTVFVHAVDENGQAWGGEDSKPQAGAMPTLQWPVGRVISDTHTIQIDLKGPTQGYRLEVGIYNTATGERAPTQTGATEVYIGGSNE